MGFREREPDSMDFGHLVAHFLEPAQSGNPGSHPALAGTLCWRPSYPTPPDLDGIRTAETLARLTVAISNR